jgi:ABC-type maltose transport system permease subunit
MTLFFLISIIILRVEQIITCAVFSTKKSGGVLVKWWRFGSGGVLTLVPVTSWFLLHNTTGGVCNK